MFENINMSETSEDSMTDGGRQSDSTNGSLGNDSICRDFLRGMCDRKFCKFKHDFEPRVLHFCHDFQNSNCVRPSCKFIHCSPDEVDEYKRTGEMSSQILAEASHKNQLPGTQPICNAFRRGMCRRPFCKYRHPTKEEVNSDILQRLKKNGQTVHMQPAIRNSPSLLIVEQPQIYETNTLVSRMLPAAAPLEEIDEYGPSLPKRRFLSSMEAPAELQQTNGMTTPGFRGYFAGTPPPVLNRSIILEEENGFLHAEIAQLKKQVSDLIATNEFLLDQNAALRVSGKCNGTVTPVPVTLSSLSSVRDSQGQVIRTVAASVATVPVSLATVTTCNPLSVSCPAVSIAPAGQILAPSQQILVTTNQPTQLTLANSSQAQLAIAQQNLANNLAAAQQAQAQQPQLTSQAQQLALATTTQQLTSQAQQLASQQLALATTTQQTQHQQITLSSNQQLTQAAQQLGQQLTSQAQQLALANTPQQLAVAANVNQHLALTSSLAPSQQIELHVGAARAAINTSQAIAMSNATPPMVSFPIMTHAMPH